MFNRPNFRTFQGRIFAFLRDEDGSPLVEFSILAPMFLMMMFGIIEWSNIYFVQNNMLLAARQAVRAAAVGSISLTSTAAIAAACTNTNAPLKGSGYCYSFTFSYNTNCPPTGTATFGNATMAIQVRAAKVSLINYLGSIAASTNLNASATMQEEFSCVTAGAPVTGTAASYTCPSSGSPVSCTY